MKPKSTLRSFFAITGSSLLAITYSHASSLYWDGTNSTGNADGGNGNWNNALTNWDTLAIAGLDTAWIANSTAVFGGTAGTATLTDNVSVGGLQFNTTSYVLASDDGLKTLSFATGDNTILFNNIAAASTSNGATTGLKLGGTGNVILTASNPVTAGTLTLNYSVAGQHSTGWSGTTTINPGMTLALGGRDLSLSSTSGITLNGGAITSNNTTSAQGGFDRVNNAAGIAVNGGGTFNYTNTSGAGLIYAETLGAVTLNSGQFNVVLTNSQAGGGGNIQTLTLGSLGNNVSGSGLARTTTTSAVTFSAGTTGPNATTNRIVVYGSTNTTPGQIIGPWATTGTAANAQTDYAIYSGGFVTAAGASLTTAGEGGWGSTTDAYQFGTAQTLTANRSAAALRYTAGANALALAGFTLKTNGILNGGSGVLTVSGTGALTATGVSGGNLFLTTGSNGITVSAPINDNGGAVTLVKSGTGTLILSSTTSNFSGGIVLNAGQININNNLNLGIGGGITVNGTATIDGGDQYSLARTLTLNDGAILTSPNGFGVTGVFSGNGALNVTSSDSHRFSNAANTFTGAITSATAFNTGYGLEFASIGDTAGAGLITLVGGSGTFHWTSASGTTTLANRQFAISGTGFGMISSKGTAGVLVINKDLLITGAAGARGLQLGGINLGDNTFAGKITDGTDGGASVVSLVKAEAGKWILTGANTFSGGTTVSAGTLVVSNASALGTGTVNVAGGTLESTVGALNNNRFVSGGGGTITPSLGGSLGFLKFGTGTLNLNGTANTFTGGITVGGGTLALGATGGLGQNVVGNSILIRDGGVLTLAAQANSGANQAITLASSSKNLGPVSTTGGGAGPTGGLAVLGLGFNGLPNGAISQANTLGGVIAINGVTGYNTNLSTLLTGKNLYVGAIGTSTFTGAAGTIVASDGSLYRLGGGGGQITFNTTNLFTSANGVQVGSTLTNGGGTVVLSAAQDYSGATTVSQGTLTLSGANGSATGSSGITLNGGRLFLDSSTNNNANRIGTVAVALSNGGELSLSGNSAGTSESIGNLAIGFGNSIVTVRAGTTNSTLAGAVFSRTDNGTALFRGTALGGSATVSGRMTMTDVSTLTGSSFVGSTTLNGAASGDTTKDVRIIPYLIGGTTESDTGSTFVTYDTTNGFRALHTTNQFNSTITANTNVRLAAAVTGITSNTINSLILVTGSSTIADGATLTVTSGAILSTGGNIGPVGTGTGILDFGANKGFITTVTNNAIISARITGSGGLVKSGPTQLTLSNSNNSFTGDIIVNAGTLQVGNNNGMLGNAANNIVVNGHSTLNLSNITYARSLTLNNGAIATFNTENWIISGNVTGTGGVSVNQGSFSAQGTFSGTSNTFEGAVLIGASANTGGNSNRMTFASLADSSTANGRIVFLANAITGTNGSRFEYTGGTGGNTSLVLNNRQIELASTVASPVAGHQIMNSSAGSGTLTIATDLIVSTPIDQTLSLRGTNTGANTFSGVIGNGDGKVSLLKNDAGRWILSNANTFSGSTTNSGGTLELGHSLALQNSALDTTTSVAGTASVGLRTTVTALTIGGLNGNKNFAATGGVFTTTTGGYGSVTALTLNPGAGVTTSYTGVIANGASGMTLTKSGAGTQILAGANTYTGATNINAGKLLIYGSTSTSSAVTVANGATLGGSGSVGGTVTVQAGGTFSPGNSIESIATGNLALLASATFAQEIDKSAALGVSGDLSATTGTLSITSGAILTLAELGTSGAWTAGDKITLIGYSTGTWNGGLFTYLGNTLNDDTNFTFSGIDWTFNYNDTTFGDNYQSDMSGFTGGVAKYVTMTAVPEPRAALLGGIGVLLLLRRRRA